MAASLRSTARTRLARGGGSCPPTATSTILRTLPAEWAHQSAWESWEGRSADRKAISGEIADCLFGPTNHRVYSCVAAEQGDDFRL